MCSIENQEDIAIQQIEYALGSNPLLKLHVKSNITLVYHQSHHETI